ncbi:MAG: hypothetical protein KF851_00055 [Pirellulaceae bacterium]|nr:hypothetical protein [Pirellulaceae bacterium]
MPEIRDEFLAIIRSGLTINAIRDPNPDTRYVLMHFLGEYFNAQNIPEDQCPAELCPQELAAQILLREKPDEYPEWAKSRRG